MRTESYGDPAMEELAAARDSDELCRLLVQSPWGWGSSTRHGEAVSLLRGLRGGTLPGSLVALLLCTCRRWDRVTAKLIAAVATRAARAVGRSRYGESGAAVAQPWPRFVRAGPGRPGLRSRLLCPFSTCVR